VADMPVEVVETIEQVLASDNRAQVLSVMWAGDSFGDRAAKASQVIAQRYVVVLAMNNVSARPDARQLKAGPLLSKVQRALAGWVPAGAVNPLRRVNAPMRPSFHKTKALYPLGFEIELSL
jgi:hypothetical protein